MDDELDVSVIICTWNRAELLRQSLQSMTTLHVPEDRSWELLVIDNNSTDDTAQVVDSFVSKLPLRYVFEPQPGKSNALNRGAREARGNFIIWTDDDVVVRENWMRHYLEAFSKYPGAGFFAGPVEPHFESPPPAWLKQCWQQIQPAFALVNYGNEECELTLQKLPFGVNWAVQRDIQRQYPYDTRLGPRPNSTLRGEETTLVRQLVSDGIQGRWVPNAFIDHVIPTERMTISFLRGFYYGYGMGWARYEKYGLRDAPFAPAWRRLFRAARNELIFQIKRFVMPPKRWIGNLVASAYEFGYALEMRKP